MERPLQRRQEGEGLNFTSLNPSKRGRFKGVWDAQGNYADSD